MRRQPSRVVIAVAAILALVSLAVLVTSWAGTGQLWFRDATGAPTGHDVMAFRAIGLALS